MENLEQEFDFYCEEQLYRPLPHEKALALYILNYPKIDEFEEIASGLTYTFQIVEKFIKQ